MVAPGETHVHCKGREGAVVAVRCIVAHQQLPGYIRLKDQWYSVENTEQLIYSTSPARRRPSTRLTRSTTASHDALQATRRHEMAGSQCTGRATTHWGENNNQGEILIVG